MFVSDRVAKVQLLEVQSINRSDNYRTYESWPIAAFRYR